MCLLAAKKIEGVGWVGVKNRDKIQKPLIRVRKSFRRKMERLYIWDDKTKYTEGINEHGVGILSSPLDVSDETVDGFKIRTALFSKSVNGAVKFLKTSLVPGHHLVFDSNKAVVVESDGQSVSVKKLRDDEILVRGNCGLAFPDKEDEDEQVRLAKVKEGLRFATGVESVMDILSMDDDENPDLNPLRKTEKRRTMRTTGQLLIVPSEMTLHYRAIWGEVRFDLEKLNTPLQKTFFEIVSTRKLISFKESIENENIQGI